ncbi:MAG: hypothetical protein IPL23_20875 [Saprospiraceae bacterium]|nr:hypothetical protein [Saprospiraceae bacterium]MBK8634242.1 hypothetical protein [Saprospiraceae bacterium]MBP7643922.1 hypothetical protein [Saprospiraceae bacterium]
MRFLVVLFSLISISVFGQNVGIGLDSLPTEKLEVNGIIFSRQGGVKFPDGTIQTTAYNPGGAMMMEAGLSGLVMEFAQGPNINVSGPAMASMITNGLNLSSVQEGVGIGVSTQGGTLSSSAPSLSEITVTRASDYNSAAIRNLVQKAVTVPYIEVFYLRMLPNGTHVINHISRFENCLLSGYSISSGGDTPSESISFAFLKACHRSYKRDAAGAQLSFIDTCYDISNPSSSCTCTF